VIKMRDLRERSDVAAVVGRADDAAGVDVVDAVVVVVVDDVVVVVVGVVVLVVVVTSTIFPFTGVVASGCSGSLSGWLCVSPYVGWGRCCWIC
jgi:hypothetical protein